MRSSVLLAGVLVVATCALTWPLAAQMTRSLPGDYGDPLFVTWVMTWVNESLLRGRLDGFWTANIFFPERNTLAFSEHFIAQSIMVLPLHWLTGNAILGYNVAFLLTFVLTGLGMHLLTRSLTGSATAGTVAAMIATFNQYRLEYSVAHLHTLSIHWLPFALYALHRYFETDRRRFLAGAAAALVALNLSSIYYMAYCAPFVVLFALIDGARLGRLRSGRVWLELWAGAAVVAVVTAPFLLPYMEVQRRLGVDRALDEVVRFSATLDHYRVAMPGLVPAFVLAALGVLVAAFDRTLRAPGAMAVLFVGLAFWLSLGPVPMGGGQPLEWPGLYALLHDHVPGYSGLRVPSRFAMLFFVSIALLAAVGVAGVERKQRTVGRVIAVIGVAAFLMQARPAVFPVNGVLGSPGLVTPPPAYLTPSPDPPPIYRAVESLPENATLAELPFGDSFYDLRYMHFAGMHRRRLLNGYSGLFPPSFLARQRILARPLLDPPASAQALGGATHVIVHRGGWADDTGNRVAAWLEEFGATALTTQDGATLYQLPVRENFAHLRTGAASAGTATP
jgi:hypothetical protein